jgi:hypothetical protein
MGLHPDDVLISKEFDSENSLVYVYKSAKNGKLYTLTRYATLPFKDRNLVQTPMNDMMRDRYRKVSSLFV